MRWPKGVPGDILREDDVYVRTADRYYKKAVEDHLGASAHAFLPAIAMKELVESYIRIFQVEDGYAHFTVLDGLPGAAAQAIFNAAKLTSVVPTTSHSSDSPKQNKPTDYASLNGPLGTAAPSTSSDKPAPVSVADSDGQPLRSVLACRYLEILSRDRRNDDDDLVEYCRRFELCSDIISKDHVCTPTLAGLFLQGLPKAMVQQIVLSHAYSEARGIAIDLARALTDARSILFKPNGTHRLLTTIQTTPIDRFLAGEFAIKAHPKADFDANEKFENFYEMITCWDEDQLADAIKLQEFKPVPAAPSTDSDWHHLQNTPSASSSATMEHDPGPKVHHVDGSVNGARALLGSVKHMLIRLMATETAMRLSQGIDAPCLLTEDMQEHCKALIKQCNSED